MKKLLAFDLDGTLAPSKSALPDEMSELFGQLLDHYEICVISGGNFRQFEIQLIDNIHLSTNQFSRLHLMPTCGTQYYLYENNSSGWKRQYAEFLEDDDKKRISKYLKKGFEHFNYNEEQTYGDVIEDRESQITYSVYGQNIIAELGDEGLKLKHAWDPDNSKKLKVRNYIAPLLSDFEVRVGGITSIDVTKPGIDKAYGMSKLMTMLGIDKNDILFLGDRIQPGGNDYPVKEMGIDCLEVSDWHDTVKILTGILHVI